MKTDELQDIIGWIRTTDLVEVGYKDASHGFSLTSAQPPSAPPAAPASRLVAVTAPGVGIFRWGKPGRARRAEEGADVELGAEIGYVEGAVGKARPVTAPCAGRVSKVFVESDAPVEYGQPLLFIDPRG
jgi:biotin carboxyl carrier protein